MKALLMTNNVAVTEFGVSISPSFLNIFTTNGSYRTPKINCNTVGGVGPFEYLWESDTFNIGSPTEQKTSVTTSGYNNSVYGELKCTVTDKGNGDQQKQASITIEIEFGVQQ